MVTIEERLEISVRKSFADARMFSLPYLKRLKFDRETQRLIREWEADELDIYVRTSERFFKIMPNTLNTHHSCYVERIRQFKEAVCKKQAAEFGYDLV